MFSTGNSSVPRNEKKKIQSRRRPALEGLEEWVKECFVAMFHEDAIFKKNGSQQFWWWGSERNCRGGREKTVHKRVRNAKWLWKATFLLLLTFNILVSFFKKMYSTDQRQFFKAIREQNRKFTRQTFGLVQLHLYDDKHWMVLRWKIWVLHHGGTGLWQDDWSKPHSKSQLSQEHAPPQQT